MSTSSMPEQKTPAKKPERAAEVTAEDIQLGSVEGTEDPSLGKRKLKRPRIAVSGLQV